VSLKTLSPVQRDYSYFTTSVQNNPFQFKMLSQEGSINALHAPAMTQPTSRSLGRRG